MSRDIFHDLSQLIISLVLLGGCFVFLYGVFFSGQFISPDFKESLTQVTGGVVGIIGMVAGFWLGTSLSSLRKDSTIASKSKEQT